MDDKAIISLYQARSEKALTETSAKYGRYCYHIAYNILNSREDSQESVNDTYLAAWNNIPPKYPDVLATFLGKMPRYISLDRWKNRTAAKRGGGEVPLALEELEECIPGGEDGERAYLQKELRECINRFVGELPEKERKVFVSRYWYMDSVPVITKRFDYTPGKVTAMLHRTRKKMRIYQEEEGF